VPKRRPIQFEVRKSKPYHGKAWRVTGYVDGKRRALWYRTEKEAKAEAGWRNKELIAYGSKVAIDPELRLEAFRASELLRPYSASILDAVRFYVSHQDARAHSQPFDAFAAEYRAEIKLRLETGRLRPRAAQSLRETLKRLEAVFGSELLVTITPEALSAWLGAMPLADRSKRRHRGYAHQVFEAALKKGYLASNPVKAVETFRPWNGNDEEEITILRPEEVSRLLACACDETRPLYAIAAFAGVRWSELEKLEWSDIREAEIVIKAAKSKTRSRRVVEILPNLREFLAPYRDRSGSVLPLATQQSTKGKPSRKRLERQRLCIQARAGLTPWKNNCLRHSFISYLYALTNDENKTAALAGNSPEIIHRHYRALVSRVDAERYWAIGP
jgi:integrase